MSFGSEVVISGETLEITLGGVQLGRLPELTEEEQELADDEPTDRYREVLAEIAVAEPVLTGTRLEYTGSSLTTWFISDDRGLEFGFDLPARAEGDGDLVLYVPVAVANSHVDRWSTDDGLFYSDNGKNLEIHGLSVEDASGQELGASMAMHCMSDNDCGVLITINDDHAEYPLVVDPIVSVGARNNCSGVAMSTIAEGDLIVTEMLIDPTHVVDDLGEWIEIYNTSAQTIDLDDLVVWDDGIDEFMVGDCFDLAPGAYAVIGREGDSSINGGYSPDIVVTSGSFHLANKTNNGDEVILGYRDPGSTDCNTDPCTIVDRVNYTLAWAHNAPVQGSDVFFPKGASFSLDPDHFSSVENNSNNTWCDAMEFYGDGAFGTPGTSNDDCDFSLLFDYEWEQGGTIFASGCTSVQLNETSGMTTGNSGSGTYIRYTHNNHLGGGSGQVVEWTYTINTPPVTWQSKKPYGTSSFLTGEATNFDGGLADSGTCTIVNSCP